MEFDLYAEKQEAKDLSQELREALHSNNRKKADDLYRKELEIGGCFRNGIYLWRGLWTLVCTTCADILSVEDVLHGEFNDGWLIDERKAKAIAARLEQLIKKGDIPKFVTQWEKKRKTAEENNRKLQEAKQNTNIGSISTTLPQGYDWSANYQLSIRNIKKFIEFAKNSGGFTIC